MLAEEATTLTDVASFYRSQYNVTGDGAPYTVAAVLPPGFDYPLKADLYRAVTNYTASRGRAHCTRASVCKQVRSINAAVSSSGCALTKKLVSTLFSY